MTEPGRYSFWIVVAHIPLDCSPGALIEGDLWNPTRLLSREGAIQRSMHHANRFINEMLDARWWPPADHIENLIGNLVQTDKLIGADVNRSAVFDMLAG